GLQQIPYGATWTYGQLATAIGRPTAVRAVATAVGKNPAMVVVPCHRVIRSDGQIGQFRGGVAMKRALLVLEAGGVSEF
ncbi:methylated-DNA--[protein]-cysteine S-methyltransferase, partial [Lacticaseibacillus nasuensis]